jgi:DNA (cytosine-5)-methyltransferase 1
MYALGGVRLDDRRSRWGRYAEAVAQWETLTRPAPEPTETGPRGGQRLSPRFVEWMMGLPEGHVTEVPGLTRNEQLKALGNGVVPQQAEAALEILFNAVVVAA